MINLQKKNTLRRNRKNKRIWKGEGINTVYYDCSVAYKERQERLLNCLGFKCTFQLCNYQKKEI